MRTAEEILKSKLDAKILILNSPDYTFNKIIEAMEEYATQCQQDNAELLEEDDVKEMALDFILNTGGLPNTNKEWQNALWKFYKHLTSLNKQDK